MTSSGSSKVYNDDTTSSDNQIEMQRRAEARRRDKWGEIINDQGGRDGTVYRDASSGLGDSANTDKLQYNPTKRG